MLRKMKAVWWAERYKKIIEDIENALDGQTCDDLDVLSDEEIISQAARQMLKHEKDDLVTFEIETADRAVFLSYVFGKAVLSCVRKGLGTEELIDEFYLYHVKIRAMVTYEHSDDTRTTA